MGVELRFAYVAVVCDACGACGPRVSRDSGDDAIDGERAWFVANKVGFVAAGGIGAPLKAYCPTCDKKRVDDRLAAARASSKRTTYEGVECSYGELPKPIVYEPSPGATVYAVNVRFDEDDEGAARDAIRRVIAASPLGQSPVWRGVGRDTEPAPKPTALDLARAALDDFAAADRLRAHAEELRVVSLRQAREALAPLFGEERERAVEAAGLTGALADELGKSQ